MATLDRPFTENIQFAVDPDNKQLFLQVDDEVQALVLVQHKRFSVVCSVEGKTTRLSPLACKIGSSPVHLVELINDRRAYKPANILHQSDRDGSYMMHTLISNQIVAENNW